MNAVAIQDQSVPRTGGGGGGQVRFYLQQLHTVVSWVWHGSLRLNSLGIHYYGNIN